MMSSVRKRHLRKTFMKKPLISVLLVTIALIYSNSAVSRTADLNDIARSQLMANQPTEAGEVLAKWRQLTENDDLSFSTYAGFLISYPNLPLTQRLRFYAENALIESQASSELLLAFFAVHPPITNTGRARYALALMSSDEAAAKNLAVEAWQGGTMLESVKRALLSAFGQNFNTQNHEKRMEALLWQEKADLASEHLDQVSSERRRIYEKRIALLGDGQVSGQVLETLESELHYPGVVYNLVRYYRRNNQIENATRVLTNRPTFSQLPFEAADLVSEMLIVAKRANSYQATQIAYSVDDLFPEGTDISKGSFRLRDKYTDLMWLGGTTSLWNHGNSARAAPLFYRYGAAARTPLTRAKGFYWAGICFQQAGDSEQANHYLEMGARYPDQYYGQLALRAMNRAMPQFSQLPDTEISEAERSSFRSRPLVKIVQEIALNRTDWPTERRFFEALAESADTTSKMQMLVELSQELLLDEFAVVAALNAAENNLSGFERFGHPTVHVPNTSNWTMSHAIMRQESEFDQNRISRAGARGMMQLMPRTAREQAGKLGISYLSASLTQDTQYNITLGDAYFRRMLDYYDGSYPLALGAYNAGPGRVNQWLRMNGDPRTGNIDYITWIERIPANFETRYYIMRVLGNAVSYDHLYPSRAPNGRPRGIDYFLGA